MPQEKCSEPTFVTTIFGQRYFPFLWPHLWSVHETHPASQHIVFYSRLSEEQKLTTKRAFRHIKLIEVETPHGDKHLLMNNRQKCWRLGAQECDGQVVLCDVDMLFVRSISEFFIADVVYTKRENHQYLLNFGIMLLQNGRKAVNFLQAIEDRTRAIYTDYNQREIARFQYGSCDQKALWEELNHMEQHGLVAEGVSCRDLNEVDCHFDNRTHVFHYKTGWHPILLDGEPFPTTGPRSECRKAYEYWLQTVENSKRCTSRIPKLTLL